jgi:hypothetical protein
VLVVKEERMAVDLHKKSEIDKVVEAVIGNSAKSHQVRPPPFHIFIQVLMHRISKRDTS